MDPAARPAFVTIAKIVRTRGNKGEVLADPHTDFLRRFENLSVVWLEFPDGERRRVSLETTWVHNNRPVLRFVGIRTIEEASSLVGAWVEVEAEQTVPLPEGTYYDFDLVGCRLLDPAGCDLGVVRGVLHISGNDQLVVEGPNGEYWVPATSPICRQIDVKRGRIIVNLPDGLMDLNK